MSSLIPQGAFSSVNDYLMWPFTDGFITITHFVDGCFPCLRRKFQKNIAKPYVRSYAIFFPFLFTF